MNFHACVWASHRKLSRSVPVHVLSRAFFHDLASSKSRGPLRGRIHKRGRGTEGFICHVGSTTHRGMGSVCESAGQAHVRRWVFARRHPPHAYECGARTSLVPDSSPESTTSECGHRRGRSCERKIIPINFLTHPVCRKYCLNRERLCRCGNSAFQPATGCICHT